MMKGPPETIEKERSSDINAVECIFEPRRAESPINSAEVADRCFNVEEQRNEETEVNEEPHPESVEVSDLLEEYGWMADSDKFDQQAMEEIEQEDFIEQCFEDMWQEEERIMNIVSSSAGEPTQQEIEGNLDKLAINEAETFVPQAHLNPDSVDFIPRSISDS